MRALPPLVLLLASLSHPAWAQPTSDICQSILDDGAILIAGYKASAEKIPGGCKFENVLIESSVFTRTSFETLTILAPDLTAAFAERRQPREAIIEAEGVRTAPFLSDPGMHYIAEMQLTPHDFTLDYSWDPETGAAEISGFTFALEPIGSAMATATLRDVPNVADVGIGALYDDVIIDSLSVFAQDYGLFAALLAPSILYRLPPEEDPVPLIEAAQTEAVLSIGTWPDGNADAATRNALTQFAMAFPDPRGSYEFMLGSDLGLPVSDLYDAPDLGTLMTLLGTSRLRASFVPATEVQP